MHTVGNPFLWGSFAVMVINHAGHGFINAGPSPRTNPVNEIGGAMVAAVGRAGAGIYALL
ncbi:MAG: hypothetical protein GPOALKHO_001587 [Sodalis sp.]|nr:MAG: hypothetical protein GPOALKHO_001587 [Sodalis sp.]